MLVADRPMPVTRSPFDARYFECRPVPQPRSSATAPVGRLEASDQLVNETGCFRLIPMGIELVIVDGVEPGNVPWWTLSSWSLEFCQSHFVPPFADAKVASLRRW